MTTWHRLFLFCYGLLIGALAAIVPEPLLQGLGMLVALGLLAAGIGGGLEDD